MRSIAGVVSRHLELRRGFEVKPWRSFFNAVAMVIAAGRAARPGCAALAARGRPHAVVAGRLLKRDVHRLMLALTLTTVANVLVLIAPFTPLITALGGRFALRPPARRAHLGARSCWRRGHRLDACEVR